MTGERVRGGGGARLCGQCVTHHSQEYLLVRDCVPSGVLRSYIDYGANVRSYPPTGVTHVDIEVLRRYSRLYKSSYNMGSARILRHYLELDESFPIPLSLSHGVDLNNWHEAADVRSIEPIHWSYNNVIHQRALNVKASLRLPHPWLLLREGRAPARGMGTLVIGPPPGDSNDSALQRCLNMSGIKDYDILEKYRGNVSSSIAFWERNGINVVSAGSTDQLFYERLFSLIDRYEYVISGTLSSALVFAAAIGKKCRVLENYTYSAYDVANYANNVFKSEIAEKFLRTRYWRGTS